MLLNQNLQRVIASPFPTFICQQCRHATLLRRPKRPYTFTQLVTLSDGSTYTHRTTSPAPIYKSTKDTRNSPLWNPSSQKFLNVEEDEAGRLKAFRNRFGRGWDAEIPKDNEEVREGEEEAVDEGDSLLDLMSNYGQNAEKEGKAQGITLGTVKTEKENGKSGGP